MQAINQPNHTIEENIFAELVALLYMQAKAAIFGSMMTSTCVIIGLYQVVPTHMLMNWYFLVIGVSVLRYVIVRAYLRVKPAVHNAKNWLYLFLVATVASGLTWMLAGTLLFPKQSIYQTLVTFAIAGLAAGSVPFFSASLLVSYSFILLVLLPFGFKMWLLGGPSYELLGILSIVYTFVLLFSSSRIHQAIYSALKLKFENLDLIERISVTKKEVEMINQELQLEIGERKQIEKLLRNSEEQYRLVTDALPVLISYIDTRLRFRFNNKAFEQWFNKPLDEIIGKPIKDILGESGFATFNENYQKVLVGKQVTYEATMYFHEDQERYVSVTLIPHITDNAVRGVFSLISDMTPRINYLATHDSLTNLPNRSLFNDRLTRALKRARNHKTQVALLFLDLDHFKNVNDTLGHDVGDQLLIKVVERLQASVTDRDTIARLGGDEFIIILEGVKHVQAIISVADNICKSLSKVFKLDGRNLFITTSIGISIFPADGDNMQILMKNADMAMYRAKERGRNMFEFYTQGMNEAIQKKLHIENSLRNALDKQEFMVYYQPVVDVKRNKIVSFEALLRWQHPEMGMVPPSEFIPIAEEADLIHPIGEWVLRTACKKSVEWMRSQRTPLRVSVNLSARQFKRRHLPEMVDSILQETGLEGKYLTLELTESLIMQDIEHSIKMIKALKSLDIILSIDDFGTGYSSLNYLKRFPFDIIKIDRSFITDFVLHPDDAAIVKAIIAMAHSLKMKVIAEGVENHEQLSFLREHSCDEIQGFLLFPPLPEDQVNAVLQKHEAIKELSSHT